MVPRQRAALLGGGPVSEKATYQELATAQVQGPRNLSFFLSQDIKQQQTRPVMPQILARLFSAALAVLPLGAILAQPAHPQGNPSVNTDERVLNAPFSAKRRFTHDEKSPDGTIKHTETIGGRARDSRGRTYSADERQWIYLGALKSEMLYEIDDPVNHTDTRWDTSAKIAKVIHVLPSVPRNNSFLPQCQTCTPGDFIEAAMVASGAKVEKLGAQTIGGFMAEGTRSSYTSADGQVIHESWYCPELKIVILTNDDSPSTGSSRDELVDIVRGEPDVTKYKPPTDYVIQNIVLP
jgi:hypothetical protein